VCIKLGKRLRKRSKIDIIYYIRYVVSELIVTIWSYFHLDCFFIQFCKISTSYQIYILLNSMLHCNKIVLEYCNSGGNIYWLFNRRLFFVFLYLYIWYSQITLVSNYYRSGSIGVDK